MKVKVFFAWYDLWIGFFWDRKNAWLYFLPLPTIVFLFKFLPANYSFTKEKSYWINEGGDRDTYLLYFKDTYVASFRTLGKLMTYTWKHNYNHIK